MLRCITKKAGLRSIPQSCLLFWENTVHTSAGDEGIWQLSGAAIDFAGYLLVFLLGCLFLLHGSIGLFHVAKIGGKEIGYLSDVAINAISLNKISYIPAQLFRASMKVLHSICNIFAFQMKKQMLADDRGD